MTNTMKKLAALLMAATMMLSLAACNKDDKGTSGNAGGDKGTSNSDSNKGGDSAAMSEEDYKAKITEIGNSVNDLMPEVTAAQAKATTDPQAAMKELTATVNKMKPLYTELAGLKAPEKFAAAQTKIKNGAEASVELLDLTLEMMELALDPAKASEATAKMTELQEKMTGFTDKAAELTEGLTEVMGA